MERDVRFVEMDPKAEPLGQLLPLVRVTKHAFNAFANERFDAVRLDFLFRVNAKFLAHFNLDRQAVRIPAGLAAAKIATHGFVAWEEVFDRTRQAVARMRQAVGRRRAFKEDERSRVGTGVQRFFVNLPLPPKLRDCFFEFREGNGAFDGLEHGNAILRAYGNVKTLSRPRRTDFFNRVRGISALLGYIFAALHGGILCLQGSLHYDVCYSSRLRGCHMQTATVKVSPEFQIVIPRATVEALHVQPGQQMQVVEYEGRIELIPDRDIRDLRGFLKGINTQLDREADRV